MIKIELIPFQPRSNLGMSSISVHVDQVHVKGAPQSILTNCADLIANKRFLKSRVLNSFFVGNEPLMKVKFGGDDSIFCQVSSGTGLFAKKYEGKFFLAEGIGEIDRVISIIIDKDPGIGSEIHELEAQVERDLQIGVFDFFIGSR